jgi:hypothetical protein
VTGNGLPFSAGVEVDRHARERLDGPAIGTCEVPKHLPPLQHTDSMTVVCIGDRLMYSVLLLPTFCD